MTHRSALKKERQGSCFFIWSTISWGKTISSVWSWVIQTSRSRVRKEVQWRIRMGIAKRSKRPRTSRRSGILATMNSRAFSLQCRILRHNDGNLIEDEWWVKKEQFLIELKEVTFGTEQLQLQNRCLSAGHGLGRYHLSMHARNTVPVREAMKQILHQQGPLQSPWYWEVAGR